MFCNKCGKFIDYEAELCDECKAKEQLTVNDKIEKVDLGESNLNFQAYEKTDVEKIAVKSGTKHTGIVFPSLGLAFLLISIILLCVASNHDIYNYLAYSGMINFFALICGAPMVGFGIKGVAVFFREKKKFDFK